MKDYILLKAKILVERIRAENVVPFVWSPNSGSKLAGHRAPSPEWYIDTILEAAEIIIKSKVPTGNENHCYKCDGNSLLHDAIRLKQAIRIDP